MKKHVLAIFGLLLAVTILPAQAQSFRALHQFNGETPGDGEGPHGALLLDTARGNLYGTTFGGGSGDGTVFQIDRTGKETVLLTFDGPVSGSAPDSSLIQDAAGNLYGVTPEGGPGGGGVVYRLSLQGELTILHAFQDGLADTAVPAGGLIMDKRGNLYGLTRFGGHSVGCPNGCGIIYQLSPAGNFRTLYAFTGGADGSQPIGSLIPDAKGNLYGVTRSGGVEPCPDADFEGEGCGAVFKFGRDGRVTVLHTFQGGADGAIPQGGLLFNDAGDLFGVVSRGGRTEKGKVFKISHNGTYSILHSFSGKDGTSPNGGLVLDEAGNLYGTTFFNGFHRLGTVYQLRPDGRFTVLHAFHGERDGAQPAAGLIRDSQGHLFGTTTRDLLNKPVRGGNVFELTP